MSQNLIIEFQKKTGACKSNSDWYFIKYSNSYQ